MMVNIELMQPNSFYHIYNRGINGENLFKEEQNYAYFLAKYVKYIESVAETYAYCLLKNHFHLLILTKSEEEIIKNFPSIAHSHLEEDKKQQNVSLLASPVSLQISKQFSDLFNGYAQGINKVYKRTGGLLEQPFRRKPVLDNAHFSWLIFYIHANPQLHGLVKNFRTYPHSSFKAMLSNAPTRLKRTEVLAWFGGTEDFIKFHEQALDFKEITNLLIEYD